MFTQSQSNVCGDYNIHIKSVCCKIISSFYVIIRYFRKDLEKVFVIHFSHISPILRSETTQDTAKVKLVKKLAIFAEAYSLSRNKNIYKHVLFQMTRKPQKMPTTREMLDGVFQNHNIFSTKL